MSALRLESTPLTLEDRQAELEKLYAELFPPKPAKPSNPKLLERLDLSDQDLLEKAKSAKNGAKFAKLWEGDWRGAGFSSQSEADLSLSSMLYFWAQGDLERVDALFRRSGLYREKWDDKHYSDGRTYGEATLTLCVGGEVYRPKSNSGGNGMYRDSEGCIERLHRHSDGEPIYVPLCNFRAWLVADVHKDDGAESARVFIIEGELATGEKLPPVEVPAAQFASLNWVQILWGTKAVVFAGFATQNHLRVAIQLLSPNTQHRKVYGHIGWMQLQDGRWVYLHAGGALGASGAVEGVEVELPGALGFYTLPEPPQGEALVRAVRASLDVLSLAPLLVTVPLLCALWRSVIDTGDFGVFLVGPSGSQKSELAAILQQHFGAGMDSRHFPASWSSTANALEMAAFIARHALLVIDDFAPGGTQQDVQKLHGVAERLFRAQGNNSARQRMRSDGTIRVPKPPQGLITATGEDLPKGHSIRARILALEIGKGEVKLELLTRAQELARSGVYAESMSAFLVWLAPRLEEVRRELRQAVSQYRARLTSAHARTVDAVANLAAALRIWLRFAEEVQALSPEESSRLWEQGWATLGGIAGAQTEHQGHADPVQRFTELLAGVFNSGRGHLVSAKDGGMPENATRWGWTAEVVKDGHGERTIHHPRGVRLGWLADELEAEGLYLEPEAVYAAVQEMARSQGEAVPITQRTLWKRLAERGLTVSEPDRNLNRALVEGHWKRVLNLKRLEVDEIHNGRTGVQGSGRTAQPAQDREISMPIPEGLSGMGAAPNGAKVEKGSPALSVPIPADALPAQDSKNGKEILSLQTKLAVLPKRIASEEVNISTSTQDEEVENLIGVTQDPNTVDW